MHRGSYNGFSTKYRNRVPAFCCLPNERIPNAITSTSESGVHMAAKETIVVERFIDVPDVDYPSIPLIVVYKNPSDFPPGNFVARLWYLDRPTVYAIVRPTFKEIEKMIPFHMVPLSVSFRDDPVIVATYV